MRRYKYISALDDNPNFLMPYIDIDVHRALE